MTFTLAVLWCVATAYETHEKYLRVRRWLSRKAIKDYP